jgi:branched-chain amino acid transport system ATP-binding protein
MSQSLTIKGLSAGYGEADVIRDMAIDVRPGGITLLLGANGAGKSTTLRAITGLIRRRGSIHLGERDISRLSTEAIARAGLAHVPEGRGTLAGLTVDENLEVGGYLRRSAESREAKAAVFDLFPRLAERKGQTAGTLSGGEQQMLALGRALMLSPEVMLLDEPSFGLAPLVVDSIFETLVRINTERSVSLLLVEQNAARSLAIADQVYLLETGSVVTAGTAEEIMADDAVRRAYLGL